LTANNRFPHLPPSCFQIESDKEDKGEGWEGKDAELSAKLTTTPSKSKMDRIIGQMYFRIVLGSAPPSIVERALLFAGYSFMNASAHK
jgi:hypothetical protein